MGIEARITSELNYAKAEISVCIMRSLGRGMDASLVALVDACAAGLEPYIRRRIEAIGVEEWYRGSL